jgi:membrane protein involved in colicin uptake
MAKSKVKITKVPALLPRANAIVVRDDPGYEEASSLRATLKDFIKEVKASYRPIIKAAKEAHSEALAQERLKLGPFEEALSHVEGAMTTYLEDKRRAEEARVRAEREALEKKLPEEARINAEADAKAKAEREAKEAELKAQREAEEAARKEKLKPDKEKLLAYGNALLNVPYPVPKHKKAKQHLTEIMSRLAQLVDDLKSGAEGLQ